MAIVSITTQREFGKALRISMELADLANRYIDDEKPWELAKTIGKDAELHDVCSDAIQMSSDALTIYLKPVLPRLAAEVETFLRVSNRLTWTIASTVALPAIGFSEYKHLMTRVDEKQLDALFEIDKGNAESDCLHPASQPTPAKSA